MRLTEQRIHFHGGEGWGGSVYAMGGFEDNQRLGERLGLSEQAKKSIDAFGFGGAYRYGPDVSVLDTLAQGDMRHAAACAIRDAVDLSRLGPLDGFDHLNIATSTLTAPEIYKLRADLGVPRMPVTTYGFACAGAMWVLNETGLDQSMGGKKVVTCAVEAVSGMSLNHPDPPPSGIASLINKPVGKNDMTGLFGNAAAALAYRVGTGIHVYAGINAVANDGRDVPTFHIPNQTEVRPRDYVLGRKEVLDVPKIGTGKERTIYAYNDVETKFNGNYLDFAATESLYSPQEIIPVNGCVYMYPRMLLDPFVFGVAEATRRVYDDYNEHNPTAPIQAWSMHTPSKPIFDKAAQQIGNVCGVVTNHQWIGGESCTANTSPSTSLVYLLQCLNRGILPADSPIMHSYMGAGGAVGATVIAFRK